MKFRIELELVKILSAQIQKHNPINKTSKKENIKILLRSNCNRFILNTYNCAFLSFRKFPQGQKTRLYSPCVCHFITAFRFLSVFMPSFEDEVEKYYEEMSEACNPSNVEGIAKIDIGISKVLMGRSA